MIFVTVGAQMPFDRLVSTVDRWARQRGRTDVYAQIGDSLNTPAHIRWAPFNTPSEYRDLVQSADVIVAHAGMGSILTALELGKPIIVMPRRGALRETRNDHQIATARQLSNQGLVSVAWDERELRELLDTKIGELEAPNKIPSHATEPLCEALHDFICRERAGMVDGIVCFGGVDWWYHNRGHYDIQMMRELSQRMPVIYVNSIGMRTPKIQEGSIFARRVVRKVGSWSRGLSLVRDGFAVLSPITIPKCHGTLAAQQLLIDQVRDAMAFMGIRHPLVWIACPPAAHVLSRMPAAAVVYQRTDRFEHYPGVDPGKIRGYDAYLKDVADLTVFCSTPVFEEEKTECQQAAFVDHGVDYEMFAGAAADSVPADVVGLPGPRIGFVGGIDAHTFDPALFLEVAGSMADCTFVMVGGCSLAEGWCPLKNVHFLGRKPYEQVPSYMASCEVLIMPWNRSEWIKACNPVKLKEYLATGRPVVSTPFDELERYRDHVSVAEDAEGFVCAIRKAILDPGNGAGRQAKVAEQTWERKAALVVATLADSGVSFTEDMADIEHEVGADTSRGRGEEHPNREVYESDQTDTAKEPVRVGRHPREISYWRPRHAAYAVILAAAGIWMTSDAWHDIFRLAARDEESSHIWLVPFVAAWLAWFRKDLILGTNRRLLLTGPLLVAVGWLLYAVGDAQLIQSFWHLGAILVVVGCAVSVIGGGVFLRLWPAFAVLVFLIPVPALLRQQIAMPLQTTTARITASILETLGTPLTLSGNVLVVNDVAVGIAEACNGIRMVFALTLVCLLYAYGTERSTRSRLCIALASPIIAICANVLRLIPTVWLYGYSDRHTADLFHSASGWAMIPMALGLLGLGGAVIDWAKSERVAESAVASATIPVSTRA